MKLNLYKLRGTFKGFLFIFAIALILLLLFYTQRIVNTLREESRAIALFSAKLYASAVSVESNSDLNFIFEEIIQRTNFPIILTDPDGNPISWKGIGVDPENTSPEAIERVKEIVETVKKEAEPIPLMYEDILFGYLCYGDSRMIKQLQLLPYIAIAVVSLFGVVAFVGFSSIKRSEQQFIWVGMSKETAHQIGTPLSSIMGWIELLKSQVRGKGAEKTLQEIEKDIERLNKVTARFSQIGSKADLKETKISTVISEVVHYFRRRLPQWEKRIRISENYGIDPHVPLNKELFEWVIENLLKNSLDAIEKEKGQIDISLGELSNGKHKIYIDITDNGRGIENANKKDVFKPGYSTKKRGWGLGLSLAKRIVEDYHGGKLMVKETRASQGTTMRIIL